MASLTELELKSIVTSELSDAAGYVGGELSDQRAKAMDYYLGEPFGNEMEGRSQVVSTDVADTIEWILPSLLKTFAASDQAVRFDPEGPEDEDQAEQETDYCNYVFYKENEGFLILYSWFKDALLQKNGIVKIFWDESTNTTREEYQNLDDMEFMKLLQDEELEPKEHTERTITIQTEQGAIPQTVHDVVFQRTRKKGKTTVVPVPPEEFKINKDHNSLSLADAHFCAHTVERTVSDLIEQGYDRKKVESLGSDGTSGETEEEIAREHLDDESSGTSRNDKAMRKVKVNECYIRVDYDGDGIAELRKVTLAGNEVLDNEEVDRIPFEAITPIILTHKFFGLSVADIVMDLQLIKSTLWRQMLDNLYLTNNPMREAAEGVNLDDLLVSRPGGIVRSKVPGSVNNLEIPFMAGQSFPMLEYVDRVKQQRTGVSDSMQGQNQSLLNDTAHGIERLMSAAEARIELIARIFAETGIKGMFRQIRELLQKHQDKQKVVKLRNKWVPVDPREWRERMNLTAKVGLGTGDRMKLAGTLREVLAMQGQFLQGGLTMLVSPKNIYTAANDFVKYNGMNDADGYFTDPDTLPPPQPQEPPPNPLAEQENIRGQYKLQETQATLQAKQQSEMMRLQFEQMNREADRRSNEAIQVMREEIKALIAGLKQDMGQPGIGAGVQDGRV